MNNRKIIQIIILVIIIISVSIVMIGYLTYTGYIWIGDQSSDKMQQLCNDTKSGKEINLNNIIKEHWEIAIVVTNENEMDIIESFIQKGYINENIQYGGLDMTLSQLNNIIFINNGEIVDEIIYDSRYYEIIYKGEYIENTKCTFKIKKGILKTILNQL